MNYTVICGTNRKDALSLAVSHLYMRILKDRGIDATLVDLTQLPHDFAFSALYDNRGRHDDFNKFSEMMLSSDKFVFIIPEYNGSFPGALKTFIDGMPYPSAFRNKKAALVGLASGGSGASLALSHFTDVMNHCGAHVLAFKPRFEHIDEQISDDAFKNPTDREELELQATLFMEF